MNGNAYRLLSSSSLSPLHPSAFILHPWIPTSSSDSLVERVDVVVAAREVAVGAGGDEERTVIGSADREVRRLVRVFAVGLDADVHAFEPVARDETDRVVPGVQHDRHGRVVD